jgi:CRP/FNR family transcriptional regulator, cyclic AMP receptor protein
VTAITLLDGMIGGELFGDLPEQELRRLVAIARRRRFRRGEIVFRRGDPAETLHLVVRGHFAARLETEPAETVTMAVHGPGEAFGELALLEAGEARSTTVAALGAAETLAVDRADFARLRQRYPDVNDVLARLLARRLRRTSELLSEVLFLPAEIRILRRLTELARLYGGADGGDVIPLGQAELAGLAGTSRATVNRVLRAERERGTVLLQRGQVTVVDALALAERAAHGSLG